MDFKRNIFILLSTMAFILPFPIAFFSLSDDLHLLSYILMPLLFYCFYLLIQMMSIILSFPFRSDIPDIDEYCSFLLGILLFDQKRIYYSDLGYFYMSGKSDTLTIWKQGFFVSKKLFKVHYGGNIDDIRNTIKSELEKIYQREIFEIQKRKELKEWNGCVDKKSERDDKLNQLLS